MTDQSDQTQTSANHAPRLLHVIGSPRELRSASREVADSFITAWLAANSNGTVDTLDVWSTELPEFDGYALGAKYAALEGRERTSQEVEVWEAITALADRFRNAQLIVFSVPMWNFGIPYRLKHLIDVVSQKDLLFTFDERGLQGLLTGVKGVTISARGAELGAFAEHQGAYMSTWYEMVGITEHHDIVVEKTLYGSEVDSKSRAAGRDAALGLAQRLKV
ncbi:FMN-dependent NADH-azoreductase [Burkholderia sp. PAMC 28687]|uniref:FMN-dependent NADH-azoreductase n=1 Tax=Burkholderiaceae TaxID=119060 RepID=UPI000781449D|nr:MULTISPECIES: NAD(P)H-dependent oxidoreductase [Burkholderiaceae]AMM17654.1 FMN-dependent NADH-azoreductase [Burkholderia sp. PAMC 28687]